MFLLCLPLLLAGFEASPAPGDLIARSYSSVPTVSVEDNYKTLRRKNNPFFELFLKSNATLGFGIGFGMSKSPQGTYFQPYQTEIRPLKRGSIRLL